MKKLIITSMVILFLIGLTGCGTTKEEKTKDTQHESITEELITDKKETKVNQKVEQAQKVAEQFAREFFTFRGRDNADDIGGLEYVQLDLQESIKKDRMYGFYNYYDEVLATYGKNALPQVEDVRVEATSEPYEIKIRYDDGTLEKPTTAYDFSVVVKFDEQSKPKINNAEIIVAEWENTYQIFGVLIPIAETDGYVFMKPF